MCRGSLWRTLSAADAAGIRRQFVPVRVTDALSSDRNLRGDIFNGTLDRPLVADGFVILGGPVGNGEQTLHVVEAADEQDDKTRLARDPWASARLLQIGVMEPWALWLDSRPKQALRRRSDSVPG